MIMSEKPTYDELEKRVQEFEQSENIPYQGRSVRVTEFQDITDRKQAEEALRENEEKMSSLFGSMTEMVVLHEMVFNARGKPVNYRIIDCNKAYTEIVGIAKARCHRETGYGSISDQRCALSGGIQPGGHNLGTLSIRHLLR
jgi:PAS domain-containing protein